MWHEVHAQCIAISTIHATRLWCVSKFPLFLRLNDTLFYVHTTFGLTAGHLVCFHLLAVVNKAVMNVDLQTSVQAFTIVLLGIFSEVELLGHGNSTSYLRHCFIFLCIYTTLHSHQQCAMVSVSPCTCQYFHIFVIVVILVDMS